MSVLFPLPKVKDGAGTKNVKECKSVSVLFSLPNVQDGARTESVTITASTMIRTRFTASSQGVDPAVGLSGFTPAMVMKVANTATSAAMMKSPSKRAQLALGACWLNGFDNLPALYRPPGPLLQDHTIVPIRQQ